MQGSDEEKITQCVLGQMDGKEVSIALQDIDVSKSDWDKRYPSGLSLVQLTMENVSNLGWKVSKRDGECLRLDPVASHSHKA